MNTPIDDKGKWQNVMVTCFGGDCCEQGSIAYHRLICPICENVVWRVTQVRDDEQPMIVTTKAVCPDCGFIFQSGDICLICGKGTSFYYMSDYTIPDDDFVQFHKDGKNKSLVPRAEYIKRVTATRGATVLPLQLTNGYLFIRLNNDLWLLDTGAPISFGNSQTLALHNEQIKLNENLYGFTANTISQYVGVPCVGLIGTDILRRFDLVFNIALGVLVVHTTELMISGQSIHLEDFMGIPIITAHIENTDYRMIFDTGAQISYFPNNSLSQFPSAGYFDDFHFTVGHYTTETYNVPMSFGCMELTLRCGDTLPDSIRMTLTTASVQGIVGNEILKNRIVGYFPRRQMLVLGE